MWLICWASGRSWAERLALARHSFNIWTSGPSIVPTAARAPNAASIPSARFLAACAATSGGTLLEVDATFRRVKCWELLVVFGDGREMGRRSDRLNLTALLAQLFLFSEDPRVTPFGLKGGLNQPPFGGFKPDPLWVQRG